MTPGNDKKARRPNGTGSIYQRGLTWWVKYSCNGKIYRQSSESGTKWKADRLLKAKLGELATQTFVEPKFDKTLVSELAEDMLRDYQVNGKRSIADAKIRWTKHLEPVFGHMRAANVATDQVNKYIEQRQTEGAANATINRELAALKRMFSLGMQCAKVVRRPHFPHLKENNTRKGFLEDAQFDALRAECSKVGLWLRAMLEVGGTFAWRKSELENLRVNQVDLIAGTVRLEPGETKNDEGRTAIMPSTVRLLLEPCIVGKKPEDLVFTREDGSRIQDFRKTWNTACSAAKVPGLLFHDLRRTGVRNMIRAGIPERVAMTISGHKTRSILDRYNIVSTQDLKVAARRMEEAAIVATQEVAAQKQKTEADGHSLGTIAPLRALAVIRTLPC